MSSARLVCAPEETQPLRRARDSIPPPLAHNSSVAEDAPAVGILSLPAVTTSRFHLLDSSLQNARLPGPLTRHNLVRTDLARCRNLSANLSPHAVADYL